MNPSPLPGLETLVVTPERIHSTLATLSDWLQLGSEPFACDDETFTFCYTHLSNAAQQYRSVAVEEQPSWRERIGTLFSILEYQASWRVLNDRPVSEWRTLSVEQRERRFIQRLYTRPLDYPFWSAREQAWQDLYDSGIILKRTQQGTD